MNYDILIKKYLRDYIENLHDKSERICRDNLKKLEEDPFPGSGRGDKKKLENSECYRINIAREYTAIYLIDRSEDRVYIIDLLTIEKAHKRYGKYVW